MEITYRRHLHKSYMCIETTEDAIEAHEMMILQKYSVPQLLPMQLMIQDGRVQYWFEITGKQQLSDYIGGKQIGIEQLKRVLFSVEQMCRKMPEFLLREERISLLPELLYVDLADETIYFTYLPFQNGSFPEEFRRWMEEALKNLDHQDRECVELAYNIYEKSRMENISIQELLKEIHIEEFRTEEVKSEEIQLEETQWKNAQLQEAGAEGSKNKKKQAAEIIREKFTASGSFFKESSLKNKIEELKSGIQQEQLKWKNRFRQGKKQLTPQKQEVDYKQEANHKQTINHKQRIDYNKEIPHKKELSPAQGIYRNQDICPNQGIYRDQDICSNQGIYRNQSIYHTSENDCHTQLLHTQTEKPKGRLIYQGENGCADFRIEVQKFLIGRNSRQVNGKIETDGISRIHARIARQGNEYYIEDLNSTNGTYLNGELLEYHIARRLAPNDRVRFGIEEYLFL